MRFPKRRSKRQVAVLVDSSLSWGRGIITGIRDYSRQHPGWRLLVQARGPNDPIEVPRNWKGDGVIARIGDAGTAAYLKSLGLPIVNVSALQLPGPQFPRVAMDVEAAGHMAVKYFRERGFRHFAYLSLLGLECVTRQHRAFAGAVRAAEGTCAELGIKVSPHTQSPSGHLPLKKLSAWLKSLPKPVAVLTWSGGQEVIDLCHDAGLLVPDEIALLSGSNDDLFCEVSDIPISAIHQPVEHIGMKAAEVLDRLLQGKDPGEQPLWIAPTSVITRRSTDTLAISDRSVATALSFIYENAHRSLRVSEVAARAGVSRRVLERRFLTQLRRSPASYIRRSHLERAKSLLTQTDQPLSAIAEAAGFCSQQHLARLLNLDTDMSPQKYRRYTRSGLS